MVDNAAQIYGAQQVTTASPAKLVFMLFEKAIACLKEAMRAIDAGDIAGRCNANCKAMEIILHLSTTLDMEKGGEIAHNLDRIYDFSLRHLIDVDMRNDPQPAQDVINLLSPLRDSWKELADRGEAELGQAMAQALQQGTSRADAAPQPPAATPDPQDPGSPPDKPSGGISISA